MRKLLTLTALALLALGSVSLNPARAADGASGIGELGIDGNLPDALKGIAVGVIIERAVYGFGYKAVSNCEQRRRGDRSAAWLGVGPAPVNHETVPCSMAYPHDLGAETRAKLVADYQAATR